MILNKFNYFKISIFSDDLDVSSDFYEYFSAAYPILKSDPSLWCVSAWNDNGKFKIFYEIQLLIISYNYYENLNFFIIFYSLIYILNYRS